MHQVRVSCRGLRPTQGRRGVGRCRAAVPIVRWDIDRLPPRPAPPCRRGSSSTQRPMAHAVIGMTAVSPPVALAVALQSLAHASPARPKRVHAIAQSPWRDSDRAATQPPAPLSIEDIPVPGTTTSTTTCPVHPTPQAISHGKATPKRPTWAARAVFAPYLPVRRFAGRAAADDNQIGATRTARALARPAPPSPNQPASRSIGTAAYPSCALHCHAVNLCRCRCC